MVAVNLEAMRVEYEQLSDALTRYEADKQDGVISEYVSRKSPWTPVAIRAEKFKDRFGSAECVRRCLALALALEIPVGELTLSAQGKFDDDAMYGLLHNSRDELVHFEAFEAAAQAYGVKEHHLSEAFSMSSRLLEFTEHPVKLAGSLELGIFFVTLSMLRKFGDAPLKLLARDVSRDESVHVLVNWELIDRLNDSLESPLFMMFRKQVVAWLCDGLKAPGANIDYWMRQSNKLMETRTAPELNWTQVGMYTSHFEIDNRNVAGYTRK